MFQSTADTTDTETFSIAEKRSSSASPKRIYISPPHMSGEERELVAEAFESNWIAPLGPHVTAFEEETAALVGVKYAAALSSGTAAIHLALILLGVTRGDEVFCPTLTFTASANPIVYQGAEPVFIDCDRETWNMDPNLLREELEKSAARNKLPRAVIVVDLYGQSADYDAICAACAEYDVPIIEDSAEALGATYKGKMLGGFGEMGVFSFNGNKIITTSGGGMLVSDNKEYIERAIYLACQARDPVPHYQHSSIGFNYRLSNVLAAIGRGQLSVLSERVAARRRIYQKYVEALSDLPGIEFNPQADYGDSNCWLTCIDIDAEKFGATNKELSDVLEILNVETRPIWKPLHMQPVFAEKRVVGGDVSRDIFERGLCLPSGSSMSDEDFDRVAKGIRSVCRNI